MVKPLLVDQRRTLGSTFFPQIHASKKLMYNNVDILNFSYSKMETELAKSPLSIRIVNIHNISCTKFLPHNFKQSIADQIDCKAEAV